ncbi:caspase-2-like isoform X2 [Mercenaria mercenaria]|uniref:caspase-2-like isoform X2 n=1 Tax=Mercenaria mercenaria TaxID=6596 RepID=UPI001E1D9F4E|nr:caspase-2-like isoform X2 [Mercenaria mercenaria]
MDELHRKILRENRSYLVNEIEDVEGITDVLLEKLIITNSMNQEIHAEKTNIAKTRKLLDTLPRRGKLAFDTFCNTLIKTGQRHIAEKLNPNLKNSGVTPVAPVPSAGENKTAGAKSSSGPPSAGNKQNSSKPVYPVPVQVPIVDNNPKSSTLPTSVTGAGLPNPAFGTGATGTAAGSQPSTPNDESYQPVFGRQKSKEVTSFTPADEQLLRLFPEPEGDWPYKVDMTLSSQDFKVKNCTAEEVKQQLNDSNTYPMEKNKRRQALIISNRTFDEDRYEDRKLADMDSFRIQQVLKQLDFKIQMKTNVNKETLDKVLKQEREQDGVELCVFVLVILSYGGTGTIMCTDGEMVQVQDIVNLFSAKNCPYMAGVPKLFLLQACGTILKNIDGNAEGVSKKDSTTQGIVTGIESLNLGAAGGGKTVIDTRGSLHSSSSESSLSEPLALENTSDMLVAMATTADMNHAQYSSLFMLGLSYIISNFAKSHHFILLLKGVNRLKACDNSSDDCVSGEQVKGV